MAAILSMFVVVVMDVHCTDSAWRILAGMNWCLLLRLSNAIQTHLRDRCGGEFAKT
jgi:hypothetical protein